jgi:hypothetical protein
MALLPGDAPGDMPVDVTIDGDRSPIAADHAASPRPAPLAAVEAWMQAVITHPEGVAEGAAGEDARRHIDTRAAGVDEIVSRSRQLTGEERLDIYRNAYFARLVECLRGTFPLAAKTVGDEAFDELAVGYLRQYPSQAYTLDRLADNFARYLDETRPDRNDEGQPTEQWPDFLIDLVRLEWAIDEVFDGPGSEGQAPLAAEHLHGLDARRWSSARLLPDASLMLLSFQFPVNDYYTALRWGDEADAPPLPSPEQTWLALTRREFVVRRHPLTLPQYELLTRLVAGQTMAGAIEGVVAGGQITVEALAAELRQWFSEWTAAGFFAGIAV